jgi:uncharacterized cofD-like protein
VHLTLHLFPAKLIAVKKSFIKRPRFNLQEIMRWFRPGLGIKRWFLVVLFGITFLAVGTGVFLLDLYHNESANPLLIVFLRYTSLLFLPRTLRALIFGVIGVGIIVFGIWELNRSLLRPFLRPGQTVVDQLTDFRRRERGPRVVTIGGGHGLSTLLRGLKEHTRNITAVVTVADDGGSSGRIRESYGILPPGDIRNCLAALSNDEALMTQLFQYRFSGSPDLDGHSFGNLFITALSEITGSFEDAVAESGRVLSVSGRVLPATLHNVRLVADVRLPHLMNEVRVEGESNIPAIAGRVKRVWLEPNNPPAFPPVLQALLNADMIIVGPGSLYTSLLPNLLVPDLMAAIRISRALKIYVCNITTQSGETDLFSCNDHVRALEEHVGGTLFDIVLCNNNFSGNISGSQWVSIDDKTLSDKRVYFAGLPNHERPWRHDSAKLSQVLMDLLLKRTGRSERAVPS